MNDWGLGRYCQRPHRTATLVTLGTDLDCASAESYTRGRAILARWNCCGGWLRRGIGRNWGPDVGGWFRRDVNGRRWRERGMGSSV